ncbi:histidine--tRNA ligase [Prosthecochloris sp.]|uniref:histidine--tRNA ligase n=1 Tax=Prosthecochloris sp. TaxID=290513 RepID=UPI0025D94326|nr:histidine--tRNA ligase [Prosthecochloris sp.]
MSQYRAVKGTRDVFPDEITSWNHIEKVIHRVAGLYGFHEIRTPVFEYTELFQRSIGAATDIVGKEMFTFRPEEKGRSITLRPEMTAGVMRAFIQGNLAASSPIHKLYYIAELFRKERPQAGRQRQFSQFGAELIGVSSPEAVAEVIGLMMQVFADLGVTGLRLRMNSLGDVEDRMHYIEALREYLEPHSALLDEHSRERLDKNPLRILDSKNPEIQAIIADAPRLHDFLGASAIEEFEKVLHYLDEKGLSYVIDPLLVRGLDYYCHTAFEVTSSELGAQDAIGGGGQYDGLAKQLGCKSDVPAVGFAVGLERLLITMEKQGLLTHVKQEGPQVYVVLQSHELVAHAVGICDVLRESRIRSVMDLAGRSMKAQMREANKMGASYALFVGQDELQRQVFGLKNLTTSEQEFLSIQQIVERLESSNISSAQ